MHNPKEARPVARPYTKANFTRLVPARPSTEGVHGKTGTPFSFSSTATGSIDHLWHLGLKTHTPA